MERGASLRQQETQVNQFLCENLERLAGGRTMKQRSSCCQPHETCHYDVILADQIANQIRFLNNCGTNKFFVCTGKLQPYRSYLNNFKQSPNWDEVKQGKLIISKSQWPREPGPSRAQAAAPHKTLCCGSHGGEIPIHCPVCCQSQ